VITADTSTWIAFLQGENAEDTNLLDNALVDRQLLMLPPVLTELLSYPGLPPEIEQTLVDIPLIPIKLGYWRRAGALRAKVLSKGRRARLGDALIAQFCVDHGLSLLTRDKDFRAFADAVDLNLMM
jgi:predicted nucleic acid-binding protein